MAKGPTQAAPPAAATGAGTIIQPSQQPPSGGETGMSSMTGSATAGTSRPDLDVNAIRSAAAASDAGGSAPSATPPSAVRSGDGGIGAWQADRRVTALWTINQVRNAWAHIDGIGWRKLANNSDSALVALNILTSHARQTNARVDYNEATGNIIDQLYVW